MIKPTFLGRGPSFPFRLDSTETRPSFSAEEQLVRESVDSLINTDIGERPFRVRNGVPFGGSIRKLLFETVHDGLLDTAAYDVKNTLNTWEPRIVVLDVTTERKVDPTTKLVGVALKITFRYRATNRVDNFVVPFRRKPVEDTP